MTIRHYCIWPSEFIIAEFIINGHQSSLYQSSLSRAIRVHYRKVHNLWPSEFIYDHQTLLSMAIRIHYSRMHYSRVHYLWPSEFIIAKFIIFGHQFSLYQSSLSLAIRVHYLWPSEFIIYDHQTLLYMAIRVHYSRMHYLWSSEYIISEFIIFGYQSSLYQSSL